MSDWEIDLSDGVSVVAFDILAEVTDNDYYSWSSEALLRRQSDGALFMAGDYGCSCNSFGDYLTVADLKPVRTFAEALRTVDADDRAAFQRSYELRAAEYR